MSSSVNLVGTLERWLTFTPPNDCPEAMASLTLEEVEGVLSVHSNIPDIGIDPEAALTYGKSILPLLIKDGEEIMRRALTEPVTPGEARSLRWTVLANRSWAAGAAAAMGVAAEFLRAEAHVAPIPTVEHLQDNEWADDKWRISLPIH